MKANVYLYRQTAQQSAQHSFFMRTSKLNWVSALSEIGIRYFLMLLTETKMYLPNHFVTIALLSLFLTLHSFINALFGFE